MIRILPAALALACLASSALADTAAATATLPWGDWLVALLQPISAVLVPVAAAAITAGIAKVAPWAAAVLTRQRIEAAIQAGAAYGRNAVAGAAKGRTVRVDLGSAVIAAGVQHVIDEAPQLIRAAGGVEGLARRIFRALDLEDGATAENTLAPAVARLKAANPGR